MSCFFSYSASVFLFLKFGFCLYQQNFGNFGIMNRKRRNNKVKIKPEFFFIFSVANQKCYIFTCVNSFPAGFLTINLT